MSTILFLSSVEPILKSDGTVNASGTIEFYKAGTAFATALAVYTDSALTTSAGSIITLDSAGTFQCYLNQDADIKIKDSTGATVRTVLNINPSVSTATTDVNVLSNGSFETFDATNKPSSWTLFEYVSGANTVVSTDQTHGGYAMKFVNSGSGGGYVESGLFKCNPLAVVNVTFSIKSNVATVRNIVVLKWYDKNSSLLSSTTLLDDSATNPTSWTIKSYTSTPPAGAVQATVKLTGADPSGAIGNTLYDDVHIEDARVQFASMTYSGTLTFSGNNTHSGNNTFTGSNVFSCLYRSGATTSITNSTTETTLFTYTVPANTLGTTKSIRLVSPLQAINTTGVAVNLTVRVKFGATTLFASALSITNDANGNRLTLEAVINAKNATNAQIATCRVASHSATADGTVGAITEQSSTYYGLAEDTTAAKALVITVQWASASASATAYCHNSTVEVI